MDGNGSRPPKPNTDWDIRYASADVKVTSRERHGAIISAIWQRRLIRYVELGQASVIAEPHIYGVRGGENTLLVYQVNTLDVWKLLNVAELIHLEVLDETFPVRTIPAMFDPAHQENPPELG